MSSAEKSSGIDENIRASNKFRLTNLSSAFCTSADNVAFHAVAAARRAAAQLLLTAGRAAVDRYTLAVGPTAANP